MLNQVILVGKVKEFRVIPNEENTLIVVLTIKDQENEKNVQDIPIILRSELAKQVAEYTKVGSTLGIAARLEMNEFKEIDVIARKVTFINVGAKEEEEVS